MDKWIVPITVGLIAAAATVIAAYLTAAKDRRDQRTSVARDLDLIEKLPPESEARRLLAIYIEERALLLPTEEQVRQANRRELYQELTSLEVLAAFLAWNYSGSWEVGIAVLLLIPVFPLWNSRLRRKSRAQAIDTRLNELRGQVAQNQQSDPED